MEVGLSLGAVVGLNPAVLKSLATCAFVRSFHCPRGMPLTVMGPMAMRSNFLTLYPSLESILLISLFCPSLSVISTEDWSP